jgi:hypothetical protein
MLSGYYPAISQNMQPRNRSCEPKTTNPHRRQVESVIDKTGGEAVTPRQKLPDDSIFTGNTIARLSITGPKGKRAKGN